jgi:dihydroorotate dehydrogenase (NAD+) catalytic subunit
VPVDDGRVDLGCAVGSVTLRAPVLLASGTAGHGAELAPYLDLATLGAVVVKSLAPYEWAGNPVPRLAPATAGMLNAVGLQGPGVGAWLRDELPALVATGATVVVSIWGRSVDDYARAAELLADAPAAVAAVEVNLSCPNLKGKGMFAQSAASTTEAMAATAACGRPRWAKLTAAVTNLVEIADAARTGGAEAVTLVNTVPGLALDIERRRPVLGNGPGGLSGAAIHPVAVKAVWDVHAALPALPIVGVGGVASGHDVVELLLAGASVVQVGTATFADPRAAGRIQADVVTWCRARGVGTVRDLVGAAHERPAR